MIVDEFISEWGSDSDYILAHTSGSTGTPKPIKLLKSDMLASAEITNNFFGINSSSRLMLCLSPDYIAGKMMIVRALIAGAELINETPSNKPLSSYSEQSIDLLAVVPSQASWLANHPKQLSCVKQMIIGGGELSQELTTKLAQLPTKSYATYGMTETCSHVALKRVQDIDTPFRALSPTTFTHDERGCLIINAPQFHNPKIKTNDIVELVSPTEFFWRGRYDNVINTGGIKVFPEEIERKLRSLIQERYYITSKASKKWGQMVVLVIESQDTAIYNHKTLKHDMSKYLNKFQIPKEIIYLPRFRETTSGKVIREKF